MLHLLPHLLEVGHGEAHGDRGDDVVVLGKEDGLLDAPVINAAVGIHLAHAGVLPQPQGELQDIGHAVGPDNHHKIAQLHGVIDVAAAAVLLGVLSKSSRGPWITLGHFDAMYTYRLRVDGDRIFQAINENNRVIAARPPFCSAVFS